MVTLQTLFASYQNLYQVNLYAIIYTTQQTQKKSNELTMSCMKFIFKCDDSFYML